MNDLNNKDNSIEIKELVDYAIKKIEENVYIIKEQKEEIVKLQKELDSYRKNSYNLPYEREKQDQINQELRYNARKEAELIISEAKNNANKIVNDALIKSQQIEMQRQELIKEIKLSKKKIKSVLLDQLNLVEEIEML